MIAAFGQVGVAEAVVLGDGRPHLAAMICIRFPIVSKWAERSRIAFTTYTDLASRPEVTALLQAEVAKVNATLPSRSASRISCCYTRSWMPMTTS